MRIWRAALDAAIVHARNAAPAECCGVLLGNASGIVEAVPARNVSGDPNRFSIDPRDHIGARRDGRTRGLDVLGFYQSHPRSAPVPSATDRAEASYPDLVHLIVSLEREPPETRAFMIDSGKVEELRLQIEDAP